MARAAGKADERLEDPFALAGGDARSVVGHRDGWTVRRLGGFDHDRVRDRERVVEQVADGAHERLAITGGRNGTVRDQFDMGGGVGGARGGHRSRRDLGEVNRLPVRLLTGVEPGEIQEIVNQVAEATAVPRELGFDRIALRSRRLVSQEPLGGRLKRRHRRAELV